MSSDVRLSPDRAAALTRGITLMSVGVATLLVTAKAAAWMASGSVALLASLADSTLDLVASTITFFAVRYAAAPPDDDHRFGHGKAEAFASLMQAGLVFASAALVGQEAIRSLLDPQPLEAGTWALAVMVLSTVMTFVLISAQTWVLRRTASVAVSGDRAHYASDLASNLAALAGIGASAWLGVAGLDGAAALVIAALLLWGAIGVFREAAVQLMDQELPAAHPRLRALCPHADARRPGPPSDPRGRPPGHRGGRASPARGLPHGRHSDPSGSQGPGRTPWRGLRGSHGRRVNRPLRSDRP